MHNRYVKVRVNGKTRVLHKMVWTTANGPVPPGRVIDHINGDSHDNRLDNLRLLTNAENLINSDKTNGPYKRGVPKRNNRYYATISAYGVRKHLGCYPTPEAARNAYKYAREKYYPGVYRIRAIT